MLNPTFNHRRERQTFIKLKLLNALPPAPLKPGSPIIALKGRDGVCRNGASAYMRPIMDAYMSASRR
ncbi:hypothetical protein PM082_013844 [Marasmius tenuissimus]|nr:hypothetical protein PM082_013844 [Marasmius tenuissimus]